MYLDWVAGVDELGRRSSARMTGSGAVGSGSGEGESAGDVGGVLLGPVVEGEDIVGEEVDEDAIGEEEDDGRGEEEDDEDEGLRDRW